MASPLTTIENEILSAIGNMTVINGYNYDWSSTNQEDLNKVSSFPHANLYLEPDEEEFDEEYYCMGEFRNSIKWRLECFNKVENEESDSRWTSNFYMYALLADVKKMIGDNSKLNETVGSIIYKSGIVEDFGQGNDIFLPHKLIVRFDTDYIENR